MYKYDLTIVGGGIAGLYALYLYLKNLNARKDDIKENQIKILLIEMSDRLGGRIKTIHKTVKENNKSVKYVYESGGARFSRYHKLLFELIEEFKFQDKLYPITVDKYYIEDNSISSKEKGKKEDKGIDKKIAWW